MIPIQTSLRVWILTKIKIELLSLLTSPCTCFCTPIIKSFTLVPCLDSTAMCPIWNWQSPFRHATSPPLITYTNSVSITAPDPYILTHISCKSIYFITNIYRYLKKIGGPLPGNSCQLPAGTRTPVYSIVLIYPSNQTYAYDRSTFWVLVHVLGTILGNNWSVRACMMHMIIIHIDNRLANWTLDKHVNTDWRLLHGRAETN
jgi:hypothetical protein